MKAHGGFLTYGYYEKQEQSHNIQINVEFYFQMIIIENKLMYYI